MLGVLVFCALKAVHSLPKTSVSWSKLSEIKDDVVKATTKPNIPANYKIGVGIADITGPAAEVNMVLI